jgi:hypothetical protein
MRLISWTLQSGSEQCRLRYKFQGSFLELLRNSLLNAFYFLPRY